MEIETKLDFFDYLSKDVIGIVILFLNIEDVQQFRFVCKFLHSIISRDRLWERIGERDCPFLKIKNERDFYLRNPFCVSKYEITDYIYYNSWFSRKLNMKVVNRNGLNDHRIEAYLKSIVRNIIITEKLRACSRKVESESESEFMDRRIGITKMIEQYQSVIDGEVFEFDLWFKEDKKF